MRKSLVAVLFIFIAVLFNSAFAGAGSQPGPYLDFVSYRIDDDNKVAGPGETVELIVTLKNLRGEATGVSAILTPINPNIINILDNSANFLDVEPEDPTPRLIIDSGHRADNSANPFVISVLADDELIGTRASFTLVITADGVDPTTHHFSIIINDIQPSILLVDDDGGAGFEGFFKDALEHVGFGYTVWEVQQQGPPRFEDLKDYCIVIWTTADDAAGTLTPLEQRSLMEYLESGGRLYLSSMDVIRNVPDFGTYYLKVDTLINRRVVRAQEIGGSMELTFDYERVGLADRSHSFYPLLGEGRVPFFKDWDRLGRICGLKHFGHYALVFTSFAFEAIADPNNQRVLLDRIIRWLDRVILTADYQAPRVPQGLTVTDIVGGVSLFWTANFEPDVVEYQIQRHRTGGRFPTPGDEIFYPIATVRGNKTFFRDTPPIDRDIPATYYYRIKAVDDAGNKSAFSEVVFATPVPEPDAPASGCFITTAAYGTSLAPEVRVLADFRDRYLLRHTFGRSLVAFYERHSPPLAAYISTRPVLKAAVRGILRPLVWLLAKIEQQGTRSQESEYRSQKSGVRIQESEVRSQNTGVRSQESE